MKITTWNINGIRSLKNYSKLTFGELLNTLESDIICLQEVKCPKSQLNEYSLVPGYNSFYDLNDSSYCGVGTIVSDKIAVIGCELGFTGSLGCYSLVENEFSPDEIQEFNLEKRLVITDHGDFILLNVYFPALVREERLNFKLRFSKAIQLRVTEFISSNRVVLVVGDVNVCHTQLDCYEQLDFKTPSRSWINGWIGPGGEMTDTFRFLNPKKVSYTCWDTYLNNRTKNLGSRIDYILISNEQKALAVESLVLDHVYGSDHCPASTKFNLELQTQTGKLPQECTINWQEFPSRQPQISQFFKKLCKSSSKHVSKSIKSPSRALINQIHRRDILNSRQTVIKKETKDQWSKLFNNNVPKCFHGENCLVLKSGKEGTVGKAYYSCARVNDPKFGKDDRCKFFQWK